MQSNMDWQWPLFLSLHLFPLQRSLLSFLFLLFSFLFSFLFLFSFFSFLSFFFLFFLLFLLFLLFFLFLFLFISFCLFLFLFLSLSSWTKSKQRSEEWDNNQIGWLLLYLISTSYSTFWDYKVFSLSFPFYYFSLFSLSLPPLSLFLILFLSSLSLLSLS